VDLTPLVGMLVVWSVAALPRKQGLSAGMVLGRRTSLRRQAVARNWTVPLRVMAREAFGAENAW
jgi:hypothetical protein